MQLRRGNQMTKKEARKNWTGERNEKEKIIFSRSILFQFIHVNVRYCNNSPHFFLRYRNLLYLRYASKRNFINNVVVYESTICSRYYHSCELYSLLWVLLLLFLLSNFSGTHTRIFLKKWERESGYACNGICHTHTHTTYYICLFWLFKKKIRM